MMYKVIIVDCVLRPYRVVSQGREVLNFGFEYGHEAETTASALNKAYADGLSEGSGTNWHDD